MSSEQIWLAAGGALALLLLVGVLALARVVRRLGARVATLEAALGSAARRPAPTRRRRSPPPRVEPASYVITGIDRVEDDEPTVAVRGASTGRCSPTSWPARRVIRAAGIAHGLRRALAPEARNRIRFEMKREVKRSRKQRRADLKAGAARHAGPRTGADGRPADEEDAA